MPATDVKFETIKNVTVNHPEKIKSNDFLLEISTIILHMFVTSESLYISNSAGNVA
jgi:hypothetical protein